MMANMFIALRGFWRWLRLATLTKRRQPGVRGATFASEILNPGRQRDGPRAPRAVAVQGPGQDQMMFDRPDRPDEPATVIRFRAGKVVSMQDYRTEAEARAAAA